MNDPSKYWGTPPVSMIWALKESVRIIRRRGWRALCAPHPSGRLLRGGHGGPGVPQRRRRCARAGADGLLLSEAQGWRTRPSRAKLGEEGIYSAGAWPISPARVSGSGTMGNIDKHILVGAMARRRACLQVRLQDRAGQGLGALRPAWRRNGSRHEPDRAAPSGDPPFVRPESFV